MKSIKAEIVADSICNGHRITTMLLTFPRFILAELNTHRMFSRNSASSRAIPFEKVVKMVEEDPFVPIAWQKDHKGMQGTEYLTDEDDIGFAKYKWNQARKAAVEYATTLNDKGEVTKQLCNRPLEPFMWHTVLVTATEWENFFELRCPKYNVAGKIYRSSKDAFGDIQDVTHECWSWTNVEWLQHNESHAEIHMQALAEAMWDIFNESKPKELKEEEWHIPFGAGMDDALIVEANIKTNTGDYFKDQTKIKIATARCARLSYMTFDGEIDYKKDINLHDNLLNNGHMSPFEHCARAMNGEELEYFVKGKFNDLGIMSNDSNYGWCNNFRGWIPYRYLIETEYL